MPKHEITRWFNEEVQPHESALRAHLRNMFPSFGDVDDIVQESYYRLVYANSRRPISFIKTFLFTTARNVAIDIFRHRQIVSMERMTDFHREILIDEACDVIAIIRRREERQSLVQAIENLPQRCREVCMLRFVRGHSYKVIARKLGISQFTAKAQIAKGLRRCAAHLGGQGLVEELHARPHTRTPRVRPIARGIRTHLELNGDRKIA